MPEATTTFKRKKKRQCGNGGQFVKHVLYFRQSILLINTNVS